uniref:Uncharacterized protein LOC104216648 n=1 Tax=Nicotiana sylvestris TaxID=4096 RepID=A0A1U7VRQ9_NICSY|nr:PREDICTED: uncharacterized protein LOC104216648 [Nicotiana sylvestris]
MKITETRAKTTEESVRKLENQLQNYMSETNKKLESNDPKMDELNRKFNMMMEKMFANKDGILGSASSKSHHGEGLSIRMRMVEPHEQSTGRPHVNLFASRVDFPYFEEGYPGSWLQKCERYFYYNHIVDPQQKLVSVVLHLNGRDESWYFSYQLSNRIVRCPDFVEEICRSYNKFNSSNLKLLEKFKRVEQRGSVNEYLERFEDLKAWVLIKYPTIPEEFFLGFFIEVLKEEIKHTIKILDPYSLSHAVEKVRQKKNLINTMARKSRMSGVRSIGQNQGVTPNVGTRIPTNGKKEGNFNASILGTRLFEARKAR